MSSRRPRSSACTILTARRRSLHGRRRLVAAFLSAIRGPLSAQKGLQGAGIRILTPTISSPTLADQIRNLLKIYPQAKWHVYEPVNRDNVLEGAKMAFGQPIETRYDFSKADVIVSLDADFLYARISRQHALHPRLRQAPQSRRAHESPVRRSRARRVQRESRRIIESGARGDDRHVARDNSASILGMRKMLPVASVGGDCGNSCQRLSIGSAATSRLQRRHCWRSSAAAVHALAHAHECSSSAMSARPFSTPIPSMRILSIRPNH